jgi:hypothetical protein
MVEHYGNNGKASYILHYYILIIINCSILAATETVHAIGKIHSGSK